MYKANQEALYQATNQQVISIRQSEINYYLNVNSAIGTQAALIGGFTYGIYTQTVANDEHGYSKNLLSAYYIGSAITIACAVHVIINTMLLQVLGPGLALHGPVGSMARAAESMKIEQNQVIVAFTLMMVAFSVSTVLSFWAVMDAFAAFTNTVIFAIAARCWTYYGRRVYYRLHWENSESWEEQFRDSHSSIRLDQPINPLHNKGDNDEDDTNNDNSVNQEKKSSGILSSLFSSKNKTERSRSTEDNSSVAISLTPFSSSNSKRPDTVAMEGFMSKGNLSKTDSLKRTSTKMLWERRYFVLFHNGKLFYYKSRQMFREENTPEKERPLEIANFYIATFNSVNPDSTDRNSQHSIQSIVSTATTDGPIFQLDLVPKDDEDAIRWQFRLDTEEELDLWREALYDVSPTSLKDN